MQLFSKRNISKIALCWENSTWTPRSLVINQEFVTQALVGSVFLGLQWWCVCVFVCVRDEMEVVGVELILFIKMLTQIP